MDELWGPARERIDGGDLDGLADVLAAATPVGRAALVAVLEAYEPPTDTVPEGIEAMRAYLGNPDSHLWDPGSGRERWQLTHAAQQQAHRINQTRRAAKAMAIAAGLARAGDVVKAANRRWPAEPLPLSAEAAGPLLRIRGAAWCATVGRGLAKRARSGSAPWALTEALLRAGGEDLPDEPAAVAEYVRLWRGQPLADILAEDPWFPRALPYIFDDDRVAEAFGDVYAGPAWRPALLELTATERLPRETLIAGCLRRLATGGRPGLLAPFLSLLGDLAPTADELAAHRGQLVGLLAAPGSTVAGFAHTGLIAVHGVRPLEPLELADVTAAMLIRPEKKLVRAHVAWLRRLPLDDLLPDLAEALADGVQHPAPDLAGLVLDLVEPRLSRLPAGTRERMLAEVPAMEGEIGERLAALLGVAPAAPEAGPALVADLPGAMPPPLDLDDLVMELPAWLADHVDPLRHELVLDGLVRAARGDREATARALASVQPAWQGLLPSVVGAAAGQPVVDPRQLSARGWQPLTLFVNSRTAELARRLDCDPPAALLAFPATTAGHVDPGRVLSLLAAAERDGWAPGHADLTQALLRLPREIDPAVGKSAARLRSAAGRTFAEWVGREPSDPAVWIEDAPLRGVGPAVRLACLEVGTLPEEIADTRAARERVIYGRPAHDIVLWPMITPSHREIAAAHLTPQVADRTDSGNLGTAVLAGLTAAGGPHGPATALVLAYTLANHRTDVRLAAADALLALAARPGFDGTATGEQIAALVTSGRTVLRRVVAPLTEAMRGGAHRAVAEVTAAALPALQAGPKRQGLPDLVRLDEAARKRRTT
ncbi:DUF6493 family protein [Dactylosporangium darangshiense]|uniref:DUF6493 family protein n=1 Tax=Dactylosporangium darangshiense TaxID=579108 RepID=A0ABP8DKS0_9ACTN